jgi:hypothetical protein
LEEDGEREERFCMLSHLFFFALNMVEGLMELLPERCFAIISNGVLAIWKDRETFSSLSSPWSLAWYSRRVVNLVRRATI